MTEDVQNIAMTWIDFEEIADDRPLWRDRVAQCVTTRAEVLRSKVSCRADSGNTWLFKSRCEVRHDRPFLLPETLVSVDAIEQRRTIGLIQALKKV